MSSQFHQEFPSLQAAGEVEKGDGQEEEPYGPGPSLRPQSMTMLIIHTSGIISYSFNCFLLAWCSGSMGFLTASQITNISFLSC